MTLYPSNTKYYRCKSTRRRTRMCQRSLTQTLFLSPQTKLPLCYSDYCWICCKSHHGPFWVGAPFWSASTRETARRQNNPPLLMGTFFTSLRKVNTRCDREAIWSSLYGESAIQPDVRRGSEKTEIRLGTNSVWPHRLKNKANNPKKTTVHVVHS